MIGIVTFFLSFFVILRVWGIYSRDCIFHFSSTLKNSICLKKNCKLSRFVDVRLISCMGVISAKIRMQNIFWRGIYFCYGGGGGGRVQSLYFGGCTVFVLEGVLMKMRWSL